MATGTACHNKRSIRMTVTTLVALDRIVWINWITLAPSVVVAPDLVKILLYFCD